MDYRRLGKQRVEAMQVYNILTKQIISNSTKTAAWVHHPAVLMWKGYENALAMYYNTIRQEWIDRGYKNTMPELPVNLDNVIYPPWLGNNTFHASHRANLKRKNPEFYGKYNWLESPDLPYMWPTRNNHD